MSEDRPYEGSELEVFAAATNWKNYWSGKIRPHLGRSALEVGAGLATNTPYLLSHSQQDWTCLEPDAQMAAQIPSRLSGHAQSAIVKVEQGTLANLPSAQLFDTIIYIDVLEHIEDDKAELRTALLHLNPGGKIVVLSPAHAFLYSEFDRALGHYRRYSRRTLCACGPEDARLIEVYALDSVGLMTSLTNKLVLHQDVPTAKQISFWDTRIVPISRWIDPLIGYTLGRSLVAVWQKSD